MCIISSWPIEVKLIALLEVCQSALKFCCFKDLVLLMLGISMSPLSFSQKVTDRPGSPLVEKGHFVAMAECCFYSFVKSLGESCIDIV
jgi:hypothetical protein